MKENLKPYVYKLWNHNGVTQSQFFDDEAKTARSQELRKQKSEAVTSEH